jgi:phospholipid/cholesterol/gamma-HCH transport system permease protein
MRYPLAETIGEPILEFCRETGRLARFSLQALFQSFTPPWRVPLIVRQMLFIGIKSLPIATLTALFVGMVMVLQTGTWLRKFGALQYVPGITFIALAREMVPVFTAVVVGARVAASITAELGTMKVTEQIDAMDVLNVDPVRYLVVPRFWASVLMLPVASMYSLVTGVLGGMLVSLATLNISPSHYWTITQRFANLNDIYSGLAKTFVFGAIIALVGCFYGFHTRGGAEGVGRATTTSVVVTLVLILVWDYVLTSWMLTLGDWIPF